MKTDLEDDLQEDSDKEAILESVPEDQRWDPIGGSEGKRNMPLHGEDADEDEDGRPRGAVLVEDGVQAAEFDQMLQADRADSDTDELSDQRIEKATDADIDVLELDTDELSDQGKYELGDEDDDLEIEEAVIAKDNANDV
ncbi:MAG: hypothetical protein JWO89_3108 [Verrucomicrobiaceae bacterium]|nr:hypothetical protein [Verrucomicrobiaceae bacterium]